MSQRNNIQRIYPLTSMQEGMLFHHFDEGSSTYFSQNSYRIKGLVDFDALMKTFELLSQRHDIFRTSFVFENIEKPIQVVLQNRRISVFVENLFSLNRKEAEEYILSFKKSDIKKNFDLTKDPLMRITILRIADLEAEIILSYHHILLDGWCMPLLMKELKEIYCSLLEKRPINLPEPTQFVNYVKWLEKNSTGESEQYWQEYLLNYQHIAQVPYTTQSTATIPNPKVAIFRLNHKKKEDIEKIAQYENITLNTFFQTIWGIILARHNNTNDVVFGSVVSGRPAELPDVENIMGLFINTIPVRVAFDDTTTFRDLLKKVNDDSLEGSIHHYGSLAEIQSKMPQKNNLIKHIMAFENYPFESEEPQDEEFYNPFHFQNVEVYEQTNYDLDIDIELHEAVDISIYYNQNLYSDELINRIGKQFEYLIEQCCNNTSSLVNQLEIVAQEERAILLNQFNKKNHDLGNTKPINVAFEEQAALCPSEIAVIHNDIRWTYKQLNNQANKIAWSLINLGISHNDIVGVYLERSPYVVAAILGILKTGAVYVPFDIQNPELRTNELIKKSSTQCLISNDALLKKLNLSDTSLKGLISLDTLENSLDVNTIILSETQDDTFPNPENENDMDSWAYMLYTSGSTGEPKGAITRHNGAMNHILAEIEELTLPVSFRFLQSASLASDISVWQILSPLIKGGTTVLIDKDDVLDYHKVLESISNNQIHIVEFVPSYLIGLIDFIENDLEKKYPLPYLNWMMVVGEEVPVWVVNKWLELYPNCKVLNGYGPCEASDDIAQFVIEQPLPNTVQKVPIGKPIANINIIITDKNGKLLPIGAIGELCVSGVGVGAGYLNDEQKTAKSFIPNPFEEILGSTIYKTGDLAKWLPDGNLEFHGRIDRQIKIRGNRIEIGEIESTICQLEIVKNAHILLADGKQLVAFIILNENTTQNPEQIIRTTLNAALPAFMIPNAFYFIDDFPYNLSDKIDDNALLKQLSMVNHSNNKTIEKCKTENEIKLLNIWQKVLETDSISPTDNFFEIGGHSLKATRLLSQINKQFETKLAIKDVFAKPTIRGLASLIEQSESKFESIPVADTLNEYPLSHAQKRLWVINQLHLDESNYNMTDVCKISGNLNIENFKLAFSKLIERHEILRTIYLKCEDNGVVQVIHPFNEIHELEFEKINGNLAYDKAVSIATNTSKIVFDLEKGPIFKAKLIEIKPNEYLFVFAIHHIATDGWSCEVLFKDLFDYYNFFQGESANMPAPLSIQYKDFVLWHNNQVGSETFSKHRSYWLNKFKEPVTRIDLPTDFQRRTQKSTTGKSIDFQLSPETTLKLKDFGNANNATLFMTALAAIKALIYRYTGQDDITVGSVIAGRDHPDLEDQVGFYVNTIALRTTFTGKSNLTDLLNEVKKTTLEAYEHQAYPFDKLIDDLNIKRDNGHSPLFDVMVAMQNIHDEEKESNHKGLEVENIAIEQEVSKFDLTFELWEGKDSLKYSIEYDDTLFSKERIVRMGKHLNSVLEQFTVNALQSIETLDYLSKNEKNELLNQFAGDFSKLPKDVSIVSEFKKMVEKYGESVAVVEANKSLTYIELDKIANQTANYLRVEQQITNEEIVAVIMSRGIEFVVATLAVVKAGGAYLSLESTTPIERIKGLLEQTQTKVVLTDNQEIFEALKGICPTIILSDIAIENYSTERALSKSINADSLAYLMFTSGSTGKPKGVMLTHKGAVRLVKNTNYVNFEHGDHILQTGALSFDASPFEIWGALLNGATLHLITFSDLLDADKLAETIKQSKITKMLFITSLFNQLADKCPQLFKTLKLILIGGEQLSLIHIQKVRRICPNLTILNAYGPTENATISIAGEVLANSTRVDLGFPISYSTVYIVDKNLQIMPKGTKGEILLGGEGLARGYINDLQQTADKFIESPFVAGEKLYKSGDMGMWLEDGRILFSGRVDEQVKIRGYRIEPGEVANVIKTHPQVNEAIVTVEANRHGDKILVCFYSTNAEFPNDAIKSFLVDLLPDYMIPVIFIKIDKVVINKNGKFDRKALPSIDEYIEKLHNEIVLPQNEVELAILKIWQEVLNINEISTNHNFFELGGHSLLATKILAKIQTHLGVKVNLADFFKNPEIKGLATLISNAKTEPQEANIKPLAKAPYYETSREQKRIWIASQLQENNSVFNITGAVEIIGDVEIPRLCDAIEAVINKYEILRTQFVETEMGIYQQVMDYDKKVFSTEIIVIDLNEPIKDAVTQTLRKEESFNFDLSYCPLIRFNILTNGSETYLIINAHHIISDGLSLNILENEIIAFYQNPAESNLLEIQYKDFAAWQKQTSNKQSTSEGYWIENLNGFPTVDLPIDLDRGKIRSFSSKTIVFEFDSVVPTYLKQVSIETQSSLFTVLEGLTAVWMQQILNTNDIVLGTTADGRNHPQLENQIGFFANVLVLRNQLNPAANFIENLLKVKQNTLNAFEHQQYPFELLVEKLNVKRDLSRNPIFDVMLSFSDESAGNVQDDSLIKFVGFEVEQEQTQNKYDLMVSFYLKSESELSCELSYNSDLFFEDTIYQLKDYFEAVANFIVQNPSAPLEKLRVGRAVPQLVIENDFI